MRYRLCLLMFLQYAPAGAVLPMYSIYLQEQLGLDSLPTAVCCATQALAMLCAALFAGHIADRWMPAERLLGLCSLIAGLDLWLLAEQTQLLSVFLGTLVYWLLTGPIWMLGATIGLTHLKHPEQQYGPVRLWGTIGWIASAWLVSYWFQNPAWLCQVVGWLRPYRAISQRADLFRMGSLWSFVLTAYTLTLPHTPPHPVLRHLASEKKHKSWGFAPLAALQLLGGRSFFLYALCFFGVCITFPFGTQGTPLLLRQLDTEEAELPAILTIAQIAEVVCLALLPWLLRRLGIRGTVIVGMAALTMGLAIQALFSSRILVAVSLAFNGLVIAGVYVAGQLFVNGRVHEGLRASAQSLLTFINGLGMLLGNLLFGVLRHWAGGQLQPAFAAGAILMSVLLAAFILGFQDRPTG